MRKINKHKKVTHIKKFKKVTYLLIIILSILNLSACVMNATQAKNQPDIDQKQGSNTTNKSDIPANTDISAKEAYVKGIEYSTGTTNTPANLERAVEWIKYSADKGYPEAQYKLGLMYLQGIGVLINRKNAFSSTLTAAQSGHKEAQFYLSYFYRYGIGTKPNFILADYWLEQARQNGAQIKTLNLEDFEFNKNKESIN